MNFVKPQLIAFAKGAGGRNWMVAAMNCVFRERESHMEHSIRGLARPSDGFVAGSVDSRPVAGHALWALWKRHREKSSRGKRRGTTRSNFSYALVSARLVHPSQMRAIITSSLR